MLKLEAKLSDMPNKTDGIKTIEGLLNIVISRFTNIQLEYKKAPIASTSVVPTIFCHNTVHSKRHPELVSGSHQWH